MGRSPSFLESNHLLCWQDCSLMCQVVAKGKAATGGLTRVIRVRHMQRTPRRPGTCVSAMPVPTCAQPFLFALRVRGQRIQPCGTPGTVHM